jgi:hypothetical protein
MPTKLPKDFNKETGVFVSKGGMWEAYRDAYYTNRTPKSNKALAGGTTKWDIDYYTWLNVYDQYMQVVLEELLWHSSTSLGMYAPPGRLGHFRIYAKNPPMYHYVYNKEEQKFEDSIDKNGNRVITRRVDYKRSAQHRQKIFETTGELKNVMLRYNNEHTNGYYYVFSWKMINDDYKPNMKYARFKKTPIIGKRMAKLIFEKPNSIVIPKTRSFEKIRIKPQT